MGRILKIVLVLAVAGFAGLVAYAYLGDLAPEQTAMSETVELQPN